MNPETHQIVSKYIAQSVSSEILADYSMAKAQALRVPDLERQVEQFTQDTKSLEESQSELRKEKSSLEQALRESRDKCREAEEKLEEQGPELKAKSWAIAVLFIGLAVSIYFHFRK